MTNRLLQMSGVVADLLYEVEAVPAPGEEAIVKGFSITPGGGFNAMVAAKRAGMMVFYGGSIGSGPFAKIVREGLNTESIPFLRTQDLSRDQGCCTVMIDPQGERTFVASDGAEGHVTDEDLTQISFHEFGWTLLSGYALHYAGSRQSLHQWLTGDDKIRNLVFDPSPIVASLNREALQAAMTRATWISANMREAAVLTGHADPAEAAKTLAETRPGDGGVVVRLGEDGCILARQGTLEHIAPFRVQALDTNGAGDTHIGSFIARMSRGETPKQAAVYANVAAALSTTQKGPATAPTEAVVENALSKKEAG
ncbi:PfkB family carbohydrate kinase [Roseibium sp. RKSG952]|uniref:PfkB family carbohydrate kinase n=1 Tax=Roseibium sp. RKSG952 TaxID=2529384 RepID=UPI0012BCF429|nr:PfkB family carbohydrate kinase [Roseibium sp. RKSG952]MTI02850.1 ribokinase [Roseibium sp. RKSG952]